MKLIVGLGNPGSQYAKTRHNIGRRLIEEFAKTHKTRWKTGKRLHAEWIEVSYEGVPFIAATLDSFMNESGRIVRLLVEHFGVNFKTDLLVVMDDAALPFGRLRLRGSGQDGGHRGLKSIEEVLASKAYARLRIGIAPPKPLSEPLEQYVLRPFKAEEEKRLPEIFDRVLESCLLWGVGPIEKAMNYANKPLLS